MTESQHSKQYDLAERSFRFAECIRTYFREPKPDYLALDGNRRLLRSAGSVAARYIEANESLSRKDIVMRIKICRKEAKESILWMRPLKNAG